MAGVEALRDLLVGIFVLGIPSAWVTWHGLEWLASWSEPVAALIAAVFVLGMLGTLIVSLA